MTATNMAFIVARGNIKPLDLSVAENFSRGKMYSFLSLNWGKYICQRPLDSGSSISSESKDS